jgi:aldose 1-epimerase
MTVLHLRHPEGLALSLSTLGATWLSCDLPLPDGSRRAVILPRTEAGSAGARSAFLGATVGRYANRIAHARIERDGRQWPLVTAPGQQHQLHGGPHGFHARDWQLLAQGDGAVRLGLVSEDGDQGYPGRLEVEVEYRLAGPLAIEMETLARVDQPCPVNITNHAYFNLDGRIGDVRAHRLQIHAARWLPVDAALIPLGALAEVQGTGFDFRTPKPIGQDWLCDEQQRQASGYDHAFLLDEPCWTLQQPALQLESADGRLAMQMHTTLPALQFYGGQLLQDASTPDGQPLPPCAGIALEPQFLPDSPHHPEWPQPSCWLLPGQTYRHLIRWSFAAAG